MAYTLIGWLNDQAPAINKTNLNKMDNELSFLDDSITVVDDNIIFVKNLVTEIIAGYYATGSVGSKVVISENSGRSYVKIPVIAGENYALNISASANFSMWCDENNIILAKVSFPANLVIQAPANARYLYLSNTGWTGNTDLVIVKSSLSYLGSSKADYPFNTVVNVKVDNLVELNDIIDIVGVSRYRSFEKGGLAFTNGSSTPTKDGSATYMRQRICTPASIPLNLKVGDVILFQQSNATYYVSYYDTSTSAWIGSDWIKTNYQVTKETSYWITMRYDDNSDVSHISDLANLLAISSKSGIINQDINDTKKNINLANPTYNLLLSEEFDFPENKEQNGITFERIDGNRLHIEGTATSSLMFMFYNKRVVPTGMRLGGTYYIGAMFDTELSGRSYFGFRSLFQSSTGETTGVTFADGSGSDELKVTLDETAQGFQLFFYIANGVEINGDFYLFISRSPDPAIIEKNVLPIVEEFKQLPDYYYKNDYFPDKLREVQDEFDFANGVCFAFLTDVHFPTNALNSRIILRELINKTTVPFVIYGGDTPALYGDEAQLNGACDTLLSYINAVGRENWFSIRGNHDLYCRTNETPSVWSLKNYKEIYNIMMRNVERVVTNILPNHNCYCLDIPAQNTRFVMLNTSDMDEPNGGARITNEQVAWFGNVLLNATNTKIIVISHVPSDLTIGSEGETLARFQTLMKALRNKQSVTVDGIEYDFTETTNEFICQINGHMHDDEWHNDDGVISITTTCDAAYAEDGWGMVRGTITEQAVDVFYIDYVNHIIKTVRIGRGLNRSWDYVEGSELE